MKTAQSVPDIISNDQFDLIFGTIPGAGSAKSIRVKCQTVTIPGTETAQIPVRMWGFQTNFIGNTKFSSYTFNAAFYEDRNAGSYIQLKSWENVQTNGSTGSSAGRRSSISTTASIILYDAVGRAAMVLVANNVWLQNLNELQLSSDSSTPAMVGASFSFDRMRLASGVGVLNELLDEAASDLLGALGEVGSQFVSDVASSVGTSIFT